MKIFVYGTLMEGQINHHLLVGAEFIGKTRLENHFMVSVRNMFPVATEGRGYVCGEVYEIDESRIIDIDFFEGYNPTQPENSFYHRKTVVTEYGECYMYYQDNIKGQKLYDWRLYKEVLSYEKQKQTA